MGFDFKLPDLRTPELQYFEPISVRQTRQVIEATGEVAARLAVLNESSARLEQLSKALVQVTEQSNQQIAALIETSRDSNQQIKALNESSAKMETLTIALKNFTVALIILGVLSILVPIGIEIWHAIREIDEPLPPIVFQPPPHSAPQTQR